MTAAKLNGGITEGQTFNQTFSVNFPTAAVVLRHEQKGTLVG